MRAMILAAGRGERLSTIAGERPKPMLEINGKPILEYNIRLLEKHGIEEIVINLHHKPDVVTEYFGDGTKFGVTIEYSYEPVLLGTAGAVKRVEDRLGEDFLVVYGDNLSTCDLGTMIRLHRSRHADVTMALFHRDDPWQSGIVELADDDRIVRFVEKPHPSETFSRWVNAGYLVLNRRVLAYVPEKTFADFGRDLFPRALREGAAAFGYRMREDLWWIDSPLDYERTLGELQAHPERIS